MVDITVTGASYSAESRAWVDGDLGEVTRRSVTLDLTAFDRATHCPNGYIPSGIALAPVSTAGDEVLYGPATGADVEGFLWNSTTVHPGVERVGAPLWEGPGYVRTNRLPFELPAGAADALAAWFKFRAH